MQMKLQNLHSTNNQSKTDHVQQKKKKKKSYDKQASLLQITIRRNSWNSSDKRL